MGSYRGLTFYEAVVRLAVWKLLAHVVAYITEVERLEVSVAQDMEQYENGHHLAVGHEARAVAATFAADVQRVFFSSGAKYLQNSSRIQKISIIFAFVMGMGILM